MPDAAEFGQRAFQFAARFCFPRLSGTPGDRDAQELIKKTFSGLDQSTNDL